MVEELKKEKNERVKEGCWRVEERRKEKWVRGKKGGLIVAPVGT